MPDPKKKGVLDSLSKGGWTPLGRQMLDSLHAAGVPAATRVVGRGLVKEVGDSMKGPAKSAASTVELLRRDIAKLLDKIPQRYFDKAKDAEWKAATPFERDLPRYSMDQPLMGDYPKTPLEPGDIETDRRRRSWW